MGDKDGGKISTYILNFLVYCVGSGVVY